MLWAGATKKIVHFKPSSVLTALLPRASVDEKSTRTHYIDMHVCVYVHSNKYACAYTRSTHVHSYQQAIFAWPYTKKLTFLLSEAAKFLFNKANFSLFLCLKQLAQGGGNGNRSLVRRRSCSTSECLINGTFAVRDLSVGCSSSLCSFFSYIFHCRTGCVLC